MQACWNCKGELDLHEGLNARFCAYCDAWRQSMPTGSPRRPSEHRTVIEDAIAESLLDNTDLLASLAHA